MRFLRHSWISQASRIFRTQTISTVLRDANATLLGVPPKISSGSGPSGLFLRSLHLQVQRHSSENTNSRSRSTPTDEDEENLEELNSNNIDIPVDGSDEGTGSWLSDEQIQELTNGDEDSIRKVKFIQMEHELGRQEGHRMPSKIQMKNWFELMEMASRGRRKKYFDYLWQNEMKQLSAKRKKILAQEQRIKEFGELPPRPTLEEDVHGMTYGLTRNTLFLRLYDTRINAFFHHRVISAMVLGQPLVIDCGYDEHMTPRECKNCAVQIEYLLTDNRQHFDPMDIHLCNARRDSKLIRFLQTRIPILFEPEYALNITEKSYLDLFPKRELVYLTPHAREEIREYSEDEIYIIGAMVDKTDPRPYSLAKAKKEGLKMKKLPLDHYLDFGSGSGKSLTINQMGNIMLDIRTTGDWNSALQFVPRRKLRRNLDEDGNELEFRRREKPSDVLTDFELMTKRKGFKGFSPNNVPSKSPNLRTIMSDN